MHFVGTLSRNSSPKKGQQSEPLCCRLIPFKLLFTVILPITWTYGAALCSWQQFFMLAPFANSYLFQYLFLWHGSRSLCGREGLSEENSLSLALSPSLSLSLSCGRFLGAGTRISDRDLITFCRHGVVFGSNLLFLTGASKTRRGMSTRTAPWSGWAFRACRPRTLRTVALQAWGRGVTQTGGLMRSVPEF